MLVDGTHAAQRVQKGDVAEDEINDEIENDHRCRIEGRNKIYCTVAVQNAHDGGHGKDNHIGTTGRVGAEVGRKKNLIVARNFAGHKRPKNGGENSVTHHVLKGIKDEFVRAQGKLAVPSRLFVKGSRNALLKFAIVEAQFRPLKPKLYK